MILETFINFVKGANDTEAPNRQERIVIVDPFIDEETQKARQIEQQTRERIFAKIDNDNDELKSVINELINKSLNMKQIGQVNNKVLDHLTHYLQATKKQRGWSWETLQTAIERITGQIKDNESLFLTSPNYYHLIMQHATEDLY